jgi:hypothetical protein
MSVSKERKQEHWATVQTYIRRTHSLSEAQMLAHSEGVSFNNIVWITAYAKILESVKSIDVLKHIQGKSL